MLVLLQNMSFHTEVYSDIKTSALEGRGGNSFGSIARLLSESEITYHACAVVGHILYRFNGILFAESQEYGAKKRRYQESCNRAHVLPNISSLLLSTVDFIPWDANGGNRQNLSVNPGTGRCIQLAIIAKPAPGANGNVDKMYKLEVGYNKGTGRWRPGALRCYLTHVPSGPASADQARAAEPHPQAPEERERER